jgi:hypothetical protein
LSLPLEELSPGILGIGQNNRYEVRLLVRDGSGLIHGGDRKLSGSLQQLQRVLTQEECQDDNQEGYTSTELDSTSKSATPPILNIGAASSRSPTHIS